MESRSTREQQQPWSYSCSFAASFAWPPRSYSCSFCKREFRSAQALGGHMNVHRRDRARLRHCSPPPHPAHPVAAAANLNPRSAAATPLPNLNYPPPPSLYHPNSRSKNHDMHIIPSVAVKARALEVNLELGFGVQCCTEDDGLDLELRLGCS